jgi:hypothetical protein
MSQRWIGASARVLGVGTAAAAAAYGAYVGLTWSRYGQIAERQIKERDELLDSFMPRFEVLERHHIKVAAPATLTFAAAREQDLLGLPLVRLIFKTREVVLGAKPADRSQPRELLAAVKALGWGVLAERPDRPSTHLVRSGPCEIVMGAVTRPWEPDVTFQAIPPPDFASFSEPGFVKIAWTLRADPIDASTSVFRTETRAIATDDTARVRFRRYWAFVSPGIWLIRRLSLGPLKREAERRFQLDLLVA